MAIITLLTDFGYSDHYVAALKAKILSVNPGLTIIDISHHLITGDLAHASFTLKSIFNEFPEGTVHLVAVGATGHPDERYIAINIEGQYIVTPDSGLAGLLSDKEGVAIEINKSGLVTTTFIAKELLAPTAAKIASGVALTDIGSGITDYKKMLPRHLKATKKQISGHVIRIDNYGNAITNIDKEPFDILSKGKAFTITFGRHHARRINSHYSQVESGDYFVLFNNQNLLEIGIYMGKASQLLGLDYDSPVNINFEE